MAGDTANSAAPDEGPMARLVVLPFRISVEIAFKSLRVRSYRSLITTMSLVLAVSFLAFIRVDTDVVNGILSTGDPEHRQMLIRSGYDLAADTESVGSSPKQRWIVFLSLLVCMVGIINAQLMAVTERFREIGTMKCLGALNRFIVRLFLLEAGMQGLVGAFVGALAGGIFAVLNSVLRYGTNVMATLSWSGVFHSLLISLVVGCLLSIIGVLYPAIVAARMQPVEAMRIET